MTDTPDPSNARRIGLMCLFATAIGWGLNWPVIKIILREWSPLFSRGMAGVIAATGLFAIALARRERIAVPPHTSGRLLGAAMLNVFAWIGLSTIAMKSLSVAEGALLAYTMPVWATLLSWPVRGVKPTTRDLLALALALAGVVVLLAGPGFALGAGKVPAALLMLCSAVLFAFGTVLGVSAIPMPAIPLTAWQVALGCTPMVILGLLFETPPTMTHSTAGWASMAYMTVVPLGVCYLTWFETTRILPAAVASTGMLMVPIIGILSAALVIGEPIGLRESVAVVLTLTGVWLAVRKPVRDTR